MRSNFVLMFLVAIAASVNVWFALSFGNPLNWAVALFASLVFLKRWD